MNKFDFLTQLRARLWALPEEDKQRSVDYYGEMIDDRMEDGLSEEEAVAAVGDLEEIIQQILSETPRPPQAVKPAENQGQKKTQKQDNTKTWMVILLILGSPLWIPLITSAVATIISVYVSLWAVIISLYAVFIALAASAVGCIVGSFFMIGSMGKVIVTWGAALLCAGLAILFLLLANLAAKGLVALTKLIWNGVTGIFHRKERTV